MTSLPEPDQAVHLDLPATPRFLAAARVVAASLGAEVGLSVDDLDDLRLGVNELLAALVDGAGPEARVKLTFVAVDRAVTVRGAVEGEALAAEPDQLTQRIVAAVTDHYEFGPMSFLLTKASSLREPA